MTLVITSSLLLYWWQMHNVIINMKEYHQTGQRPKPKTFDTVYTF